MCGRENDTAIGVDVEVNLAGPGPRMKMSTGDIAIIAGDGPERDVGQGAFHVIESTGPESLCQKA